MSILAAQHLHALVVGLPHCAAHSEGIAQSRLREALDRGGGRGRGAAGTRAGAVALVLVVIIDAIP